MRTTRRASLAILTSVAVLVISAVAAAGSTAQIQGPKEDTGGGIAAACVAPADATADPVPCNDIGQPVPGGGMAMCAQGVPDCNDMNLGSGGQSEPGSAGGGEPVEVPPAGGTDGSTGTGGDPTCGETVQGPDGTVSSTPCDPAEPPPPVEPAITEPTPGMANVYARPFDSAMVGDDDVTVTLDFVSGIEPCYVLDHVDVAYRAATVTITLFEGNDDSDGQVACIDIGVFKRTIVTLGQPLAGRTIVDGATA